MEREGFSYRRTTTKKKKNLSSDDSIAAITKFYLDTRAFQRTDPGIAWERVFNRDQVPMALADSYSSTIDEKNRDVIWDATFDSADVKRFCSLNLTIPMSAEADLSNLIRPHIVFKATRFVRGEDQSKRDKNGTLERDLWDKRVNVSFQENEWVDAKTNLYGLTKAKEFFDKWDKSVQFEDNLTSHTTPAVNDFQQSLTCVRILCPPDLTQVLQPIDRHVGIQYKTDVYKAVRSHAMKILRNGKGFESTRMTPLAKRVLITKSVADTHERLAKSNSFVRSFIATGT